MMKEFGDRIHDDGQRIAAPLGLNFVFRHSGWGNMEI